MKCPENIRYNLIVNAKRICFIIRQWKTLIACNKEVTWQAIRFFAS